MPIESNKLDGATSVELLYKLPTISGDDFILDRMAVKSVRTRDHNYIDLIDVLDPSIMPLFVIQYSGNNYTIVIITDGYKYREIVENGPRWYALFHACVAPSKSLIADWIKEYANKI